MNFEHKHKRYVYAFITYMYNKFKVHVVWLDFLQVWVNYFDIRGFFTSFLMNASIIEPRTKKNYKFNDGGFQKELFNCKDN